MKATNQQFTRLIDGKLQFVIPVFQRDYAWTPTQCSQMWHDIIRASEGRGDGGHFMGSIVYVVADKNVEATFNRFLVIDGQQRLTTLILLLAALRDHIGETGWTGGDDSPTVGEINDCYLKNRYQKEGRAYKLVLRRADDVTLRALIDEEDSKKAEESELVRAAYDCFRKHLRGKWDPDEVYRGIGRLNIVDVTLDPNIDDPQLIFESLNSTGIDLSQSDLVRNYLLMGLAESEQTRLYEKHWSKMESYFREANRSPDFFLRDYVALKTKTTTKIRADLIYDAFKKYKRKLVDDLADDGDPLADIRNTNLENLLKDMVRFSRYYLSLRGDRKQESNALAYAMRRVSSLATTHMLLGMRLYDCYEDNRGLSESEFRQALHLIESYIIRRGILGLSSHGYWSVFARMARFISRSEAEPLEALKVAFARGGFPQDEDFDKEIQECNLYSRRKLCRHVLEHLENDGQKERSPVGEYSVEHIMPRGVEAVPQWQQMLGENWEKTHNAWLHRLGNLTLTGYNQNLSNRPFDEKKTIVGGFNNSAVRLNGYVRNQEAWTETQMEERGKSLAEKALEIWPHHGADEELIREADIIDLRARADSRHWSSLSIENARVKELLHMALNRIRDMGDVIEVIERTSVCCYRPEFFVELLPMSQALRVILPLDLHEAGLSGNKLAYDTTDWKFVPRRVHTECSMLVKCRTKEQLDVAMPAIRRAFEMASE